MRWTPGPATHANTPAVARVWFRPNATVPLPRLLPRHRPEVAARPPRQWRPSIVQQLGADSVRRIVVALEVAVPAALARAYLNRRSRDCEHESCCDPRRHRHTTSVPGVIASNSNPGDAVSRMSLCRRQGCGACSVHAKVTARVPSRS